MASAARSKWRIAVSNLSRHPVLQNPTTLPSYRVSECARTGLPDPGEVWLMQSAMSSSIIPRSLRFPARGRYRLSTRRSTIQRGVRRRQSHINSGTCKNEP